jgi:hypothetical protein
MIELQKNWKKNSMTKYDRLINTISTQLFTLWKDGYEQHPWSEENSKKIAHSILTLVEKYQEDPKTMRWRATD